LTKATIPLISTTAARSPLGLPAAAADILRSTGLDCTLGRPVSPLSHGQKQSLELAMVALEPKTHRAR
jgi:ABC-type uncharacterized transport system ATPase subunit